MVPKALKGLISGLQGLSSTARNDYSVLDAKCKMASERLNEPRFSWARVTGRGALGPLGDRSEARKTLEAFLVRRTPHQAASAANRLANQAPARN
jgi:hypothetical protein